MWSSIGVSSGSERLMCVPPPPVFGCSAGTPQCFLLTPKLLPDLPFTRDVKVRAPVVATASLCCGRPTQIDTVWYFWHFRGIGWHHELAGSGSGKRRVLCVLWP